AHRKKFCPRPRSRRNETGDPARNGKPDQTADGCSAGLQPLALDAEALWVRNTQTMGGESLFFGLLARENRSGSHTRLCQVDRCLPRKNARRVPEPAKHLPNHRRERAFELFFNRLLLDRRRPRTGLKPPRSTAIRILNSTRNSEAPEFFAVWP